MATRSPSLHQHRPSLRLFHQCLDKISPWLHPLLPWNGVLNLIQKKPPPQKKTASPPPVVILENSRQSSSIPTDYISDIYISSKVPLGSIGAGKWTYSLTSPHLTSPHLTSPLGGDEGFLGGNGTKERFFVAQIFIYLALALREVFGGGKLDIGIGSYVPGKTWGFKKKNPP